MRATVQRTATDAVPWLLFVFTLPAKSASARVDVWRKLQRYGAIALRNSGYLLPNSPSNRERFEWLAAVIRRSHGEGSVVGVCFVDDFPPEQLHALFREERSRDYEELAAQIRKALDRRNGSNAQIARFRKRLEQIAEIDFFAAPARGQVEALLARAEGADKPPRSTKGIAMKKQFANRIWVTRPRPGIDRVSSAWLIRRFIDPNAKFVFAPDARQRTDAISFDMYQPGGFGHEGDNCTFETLVKKFAIRDPGVRSISQIIHDADLHDEKFGRDEGVGLDRVLKGWAAQGIADDDLLARGMDLIQGLYDSLNLRSK